MGLRVLWSRQSHDHLQAIRRRIREDKPVAAERMRLRIRETVKRLGMMPGIGHAGRRRDTMEFVVAPYIIVYRTTSVELVVLGIFHGAREKWEDFSEE